MSWLLKHDKDWDHLVSVQGPWSVSVELWERGGVILRAGAGLWPEFINFSSPRPAHQPQHPHQPACRRPIFQIFSAENWNVNNSGVVTEEEGCGEGAVQSRLAGYLVHTQPAMAAPQPNTNRVEANSLDNFSFPTWKLCFLRIVRNQNTYYLDT